MKILHCSVITFLALSSSTTQPYANNLIDLAVEWLTRIAINAKPTASLHVGGQHGSASRIADTSSGDTAAKIADAIQKAAQENSDTTVITLSDGTVMYIQQELLENSNGHLITISDAKYTTAGLLYKLTREKRGWWGDEIAVMELCCFKLSQRSIDNGHAHLLLLEVIKEAEKRGCKKIKTFISITDTRKLELYKNVGFISDAAGANGYEIIALFRTIDAAH